MGYPMTYPRVVNRNGLTGNYASTPGDAEATWKRMIAGDLRRLEQDARDDAHITRFAKAAGISKPKARAVLDAFFTDFGFPGPLPWLGADPHPALIPQATAAATRNDPEAPGTAEHESPAQTGESR